MLKFLIRLTVFSVLLTSCVLQAPSNKRTTDSKTSSAVEAIKPASTSVTNPELNDAFIQFDSEIRNFSQSNASAVSAIDSFKKKSRMMGNTTQQILEGLTLAGDFSALKTAEERKIFLEGVAMKKVLEVTVLTEDENLSKVELKDFNEIHSLFNDYKVFSKKLLPHLTALKTELNNTYAKLNARLTEYKKYSEQNDIQERQLAARNGQTTKNFTSILAKGRSVFQSIKRRLDNIVANYENYSDEQKESMLNLATNLTESAIYFENDFLAALRPYATEEREVIYDADRELIQGYLSQIRDLNLTITKRFINSEHFGKSVGVVSYELGPLGIDKLAGKKFKASLDSSVGTVLRLLDSVTDTRIIESTTNMLADKIDRIKRENLALEEKIQFIEGYKGTLLNQINSDKENAIRLMAVLHTFPAPPELTDLVPEKVIVFKGLIFKIIFSQMIADDLTNREEIINAWLDIPTGITKDEYDAITRLGKRVSQGVILPSVLRNLRTALEKGSAEVLKILK